MANHNNNIQFDGTLREIKICGELVSTQFIYSRWKDWVLTDMNAKYLPAFRVDDTNETPYHILDNGWTILSIS
jgi:hypothetical protein